MQMKSQKVRIEKYINKNETINKLNTVKTLEENINVNLHPRYKSETNRKNSDKRKNTLEDADDSLYELNQLSDDSVLIKTIHGEIVTPENVYDVINSDNVKKKANATIFEKISYLK